MSRDVAFGVAGLVLAAGYYLMATAIPGSQLADSVGPQGLPKIYALVLAALSAILIIRSLSGGRGTGEGGAFRSPERHALWRGAGLLAFGVVYLLVVPWVGYIVSIAALIVATTWYQGGVINRQVIGVAVSGAAVFWLLFVVLLGIPHPPGVWPSFF